MNDPCCFACRSATGVCLTRWQCEHHREADKRDEANHRARRTYNNPTQEQAIRNIERDRRGK